MSAPLTRADLPGFFVIEQEPGKPDRAIGHYATYAEAQTAHDALEPEASRPHLPWPLCWRYMITGESGPNDCRRDLYAQSQRYHADLAAAAADAPPRL